MTKTEKIIASTSDGPINLHVFYPEHSNTKPLTAIIVLQEAFGVNDNINSICSHFVRDGFLVVAPELFHRAGSDIIIPYDQFPKVMSILGPLTNDQLSEDVKAAYDFIKNIKNLKIEKIGSIGFCMGGFTSILAACRLPLDFAISCYGGGISNERPGIGFTPFLTEFKSIHCPVLLIYGEKDHSIPLEQIEQIRNCLKNDEINFKINVYPDAGHAFMREGQPVFHSTAAPEAWQDIINWLKPYKSC